MYIMLSSTVPASFCFATDRRAMAVGMTFETSRQSRLWAIVFSKVHSEVAEKAALNGPIARSLRCNTHKKKIMCSAWCVKP
jgi:hypothetical protein